MTSDDSGAFHTVLRMRFNPSTSVAAGTTLTVGTLEPEAVYRIHAVDCIESTTDAADLAIYTVNPVSTLCNTWDGTSLTTGDTVSPATLVGAAGVQQAVRLSGVQRASVTVVVSSSALAAGSFDIYIEKMPSDTDLPDKSAGSYTLAA